MNLGNGESGLLSNLVPSGNTLYPVTFNKIQSHDLMFGFRWMLQEPAPAYAPPLIRKG